MTTTIATGGKRVGFYLHTGWHYEYPFAVRTWTDDDHSRFYSFLQAIGFNLVMFWPLSESMPAPLSDDDRLKLLALRNLPDIARSKGLEFWFALCPNVTSRPEIAAEPFEKRHLYPFKVEVRLDDEAACEAYLTHRRRIISVLNNADGYVTIDGDPGGYPGAKPGEFMRVMANDRETLDEFGTHPQKQKLISWLWCGWGSDWEKNGYWNEPLEPLTAPLIQALAQGLAEPWELLPGRSNRDGWANGRDNFRMVDEEGLVSRSTLMCYEIVEYEPVPPAITIQFDDIRRVLRQEARLISESLGVMANAQQPVMAIPNLYFFAKGAQDSEYLNRSDTEVLKDLAAELGGPADLLVPAWRALSLGLDSLPEQLPEQLRAAHLGSELASLLPGGASRYLELLSEFVLARQGVLKAVGESSMEDVLAGATAAVIRWWRTHRYVFTGDDGDEFAFKFTHHLLLDPLWKYAAGHSWNAAAVDAAAACLEEEGILDRSKATRLITQLWPKVE